MVEVAGLRILQREADMAAVRERHVDVVVIAAGDASEVAVEHAEVVVVVEGDDLVADRERVAVDLPAVGPEPAGVTHPGPGGSVEGADLVAAASKEQDVSAAFVRFPPSVDDCFDVVAGVEAAVTLIGVGDLRDSTLPEVGEHLAFPVGGLSVVLGQLVMTQATSETGERAASLDRGELRRVANEHDLRSGSSGSGNEGLELAGADHASLVDDDDRPAVEPAPAGFEVAKESVKRRGRDAGPVLELLRSACGERAPDHRVPVASPRVARCGEGAGLP